jgi:crotonobetainyl-CoA:carnitine CoA-transferase CaiB-like acyl-CoA transferase
MAVSILHGLRILDFSWVLAGPYATRILADFGAEVIKVQSRKIASGVELNTTGYFNTWNRGKLSIALDLSHHRGRDLVLRLVGMSDVVVENFTPRVMPNWGLSYENLKKVKPNLIMVSMSGMGQTGPWRDFVALGPTVQALSGITYLTSFSIDSPMGLGYSHADHIAGLYLSLAILAALEYRDRIGKGQYIDVSEYEAMCTMLGPVIMDYAVNHNPIMPQGNNPDYTIAAPYGCYKCLGDDKWCVIAVFTDEEWRALCCVLGNPPWTKETRFSTMKQRQEQVKALNELLEQWTTRYSPEEVTSLLQGVGVAASVVKDACELAKDPQLVARGFFTKGSHPLMGETTSDSTPIRLDRTPAQFKRMAPLLGQDNNYVYQELLGMSEQELSRYIEDGVIS